MGLERELRTISSEDKPPPPRPEEQQHADSNSLETTVSGYAPVGVILSLQGYDIRAASSARRSYRGMCCFSTLVPYAAAIETSRSFSTARSGLG